MSEINISEAERQLDYEESTIRMWKLMDGALSEKFEGINGDMSRAEAEQTYRNIQPDLQQLRGFAHDSPHFGQILKEQPASGDAEFIMQLKNYLAQAEKERRRKMQNTFQEAADSLNEFKEAMEETEELMDDMRDDGLL